MVSQLSIVTLLDYRIENRAKPTGTIHSVRDLDLRRARELTRLQRS